MDFLNHLLSSLTNNHISDKLSNPSIQSTPNDKATIQTVIDRAVPLLGEQIRNNASTTPGLESLMQALIKDHQGDLSTKDTPQLEEHTLQKDGDKILHHILGEQKEIFIPQLAQITQIPESIIRPIIQILAPFVMDSIGSQITKTNNGIINNTDNNISNNIPNNILTLGKSLFGL